MDYPKIETLFRRDTETFVVDPLRIKVPVLGTINPWVVSEKIDGMNIRVTLAKDGRISFGGRTDKAVIPGELLKYLQGTFTTDRFNSSKLWLGSNFVLYGEGYGAGIQKGGALYRPDKSFVLFDVLADNKWLSYDVVEVIAASLGIDAAPNLGHMSLDEIVALVKEPFLSKINPSKLAEGVVARPISTLCDGYGNRIIIKLKTSDFSPGKR